MIDYKSTITHLCCNVTTAITTFIIMKNRLDRLFWDDSRIQNEPSLLTQVISQEDIQTSVRWWLLPTAQCDLIAQTQISRLKSFKFCLGFFLLGSAMEWSLGGRPRFLHTASDSLAFGPLSINFEYRRAYTIIGRDTPQRYPFFFMQANQPLFILWGKIINFPPI